MARSRLTPKQAKFVAAYLGVARGNATEAARIAGYSDKSYGALRETARQNLTIPDIAAAIDEHLAATRKEGIAHKQIRLDALNERWWKLNEVIEERARHPGSGAPAEAATGLLVRKETPTRDGVIVEWAVDVGLLKEMREIEKQMAGELGENLAQKLDVSIRGRVTQTIQRVNLSMLSDDDLDRLHELAEKIEAGTVAG